MFHFQPFLKYFVVISPIKSPAAVLNCSFWSNFKSICGWLFRMIKKFLTKFKHIFVYIFTNIFAQIFSKKIKICNLLIFAFVTASEFFFFWIFFTLLWFFDIPLLYYFNLSSSIISCLSSGDIHASVGISLSCSYVTISELFCCKFFETS